MLLFYTWIQNSKVWREACRSLPAREIAYIMEGTKNYANLFAACKVSAEPLTRTCPSASIKEETGALVFWVGPGRTARMSFAESYLMGIASSSASMC